MNLLILVFSGNKGSLRRSRILFALCNYAVGVSKSFKYQIMTDVCIPTRWHYEPIAVSNGPCFESEKISFLLILSFMPLKEKRGTQAD